MTRQADPTTVGQRHGPYHFDVASGSGYDAWGGRWPLVSSCASSNYESVGCCNDTADKAQAGCRYDTHDGGPGDPFEWSEFGSNAMSDIQTLRYILPAASLTPAGVGDRLWQVHKAGMCVCTPDPYARPRTHHYLLYVRYCTRIISCCLPPQCHRTANTTGMPIHFNLAAGGWTKTSGRRCSRQHQQQ